VDNFGHRRFLFFNKQKHNNMETIKEFINIDRMADCVAGILKEARDGFCDEDTSDYLMETWGDERIENYAYEMAHEFNDEMRQYLNSSEHKIEGNFNNIDYDYPPYRKGIVGAEYDRPMVEDMIKRLNDGDMGEQSVKDRDWLVDWFFETFGSFGIKYNFQTALGEELYWHEQEQEVCEQA